jgi:hypothetical protein
LLASSNTSGSRIDIADSLGHDLSNLAQRPANLIGLGGITAATQTGRLAQAVNDAAAGD